MKRYFVFNALCWFYNILSNVRLVYSSSGIAQALLIRTGTFDSFAAIADTMFFDVHSDES